jgi:hypothetical protein
VKVADFGIAKFGGERWDYRRACPIGIQSANTVLSQVSGGRRAMNTPYVFSVVEFIPVVSLRSTTGYKLRSRRDRVVRPSSINRYNTAV